MEKKRTIKFILSEESLIANKQKACTVATCKSTFNTLSNLNMHLEKHHGIETRKFIDKQCEVQYFCPIPKCKYNVIENESQQYFKSRRYLRQHYLKVHAAKNEKCKKCDKPFGSVTLKMQHERTCGMLFKCMDCDWSYTTRECLLTHCRRKGHKVPPKPIKSIDSLNVNAPEAVQMELINEQNLNILEATRTIKGLKIMPKGDPAAANSDSTNAMITKVQNVLRKNTPAAKIRANFQRILQKSRTISNTKVSQTTQTSTINSKKMVTKKACIASTTMASKSNEKYKSLELIDEESNSSTEDTTKANRNLNNLSYDDDESSLHYFTVNNFNAGLCHIETQTDFFSFDAANINGSGDMDPLLCHMHTQTEMHTDQILNELGLADIQTQTNWPNDECNDIFVSAETQTCFDTGNLIMDNISTQTQTMPGMSYEGSSSGSNNIRPSSSSKWLNNIQHNSQFTQTL